MPAVKFSPFGNSQFITAASAPANGHKLYAYAAGSSALQTTYTDATGNIAQSNPVVLNALGFPTVGQIWLVAGLNYKLVWTDAADVVLKTQDNISGVNDSATTTSQWAASGATPTFVSATQFTLVGDQTSAFHVGRRLQFTTTGGTVYGLVSVSAFTTLTTITVVMDAGVLDSGLTAVNLSVLTAVNPSLPNSAAVRTALGAAASGANTDITSTGHNTSTVYATAGTATAYAIVPNPAITAYTAGQAFQVLFGLASGLNPTLQANGLATPPNLVTLQANGTYINAVGIPAGHTSEVRFLSATQAWVVTMPPVSALTQATAQATTSGTSIDFTGIPSTAKQITVSLNGVSTNGTSPVQVQLGAGAPVTTGYVANLTSLANAATSAITGVTTGFVIGDAGSAATSVRAGSFVFTLVSANTWICSAWVAHTDVGRVYGVQGLIVLSVALDRLRLTTVGGTDTFDAGSVNIMYA